MIKGSIKRNGNRVNILKQLGLRMLTRFPFNSGVDDLNLAYLGRGCYLGLKNIRWKNLDVCNAKYHLSHENGKKSTSGICKMI